MLSVLVGLVCLFIGFHFGGAVERKLQREREAMGAAFDALVNPIPFPKLEGPCLNPDFCGTGDADTICATCMPAPLQASKKLCIDCDKPVEDPKYDLCESCDVPM